ncbi:uncharacterized protein AMSG_09555 [Thecamonas trahens ATCC 50062]|uniref:CNH domain-containing protein n=1 Tax=Thecamonas trahens ATCC 50062 TaxID=461836 RepID=A0A0L0DPG5_THETB|nr:hypothetical protein AMSG_09555 [Thecamonas trahens ATCC 50062]KNC53916.1 hypothetical protein AMSG_09555 [Thecamonas trahens ATCC 50062]|eukprot:XP_013754122.1 hypothetical protein AMSG_09555 [Thecamonas trahens ATCC 50062]
MYPLFRLLKVVDRVAGKKARVTAASTAADGSTVYVGTSTGDVLKYAFESELSQSLEASAAASSAAAAVSASASASSAGVGVAEADTARSTLEIKKNVGGKKKIETILPLKAAGHLVVLVGETVVVLDAVSLKAVSPPFPSPRHVLCIALDAKSGRKLVAVTKKRAYVYEFSTTIGDYVPVKEFAGLPGPVLSIAWYGDTLALGYKREISAISVKSGITTTLCSREVAPTSLTSITADAAAMTSAMLTTLNPFASSSSGATASTSSLLMAPVPGVGLILVVHNNMGVCYNLDGSLSGHTVTWSQPPSAVAVAWPNLIGLHDGLVEVRSVEDAAIHQTLSLPEATHIGSTGSVLTLFSGARVWLGLKISFEAQLAELIRARRFDDAIMLFQIRVPASVPTRDKQMQLLYENIAFQALVDANYERAFQFFALSTVDARDLLHVFDMLPQSQARYESRTRPLHAIQRKLSAQAPHKAHPLLVAFLEDQRTVAARGEPLEPLVAQAVDTALLRLYISKSPHKLRPLLTGANAVLVDDARAALRAAIDTRTRTGPYDALAALEASVGNYTEALEVWATIVAGECIDPSSGGARPAIDVLASLEGGSDASWELIAKFAPALLQADTFAALDVFVSPTRSVPLDHDSVLAFLAKFEPLPWHALQAAYLAHMVSAYHVAHEQYHTRLVNIYVDSVAACRDPVQAAAMAEACTAHPGAPACSEAALRARLLGALEELPFYDVDLILERVKDIGGLTTELVALYRKVGHHNAALRVLVHDETDDAGALAYCAAIHEVYVHEKAQAERLGVPLSTLGVVASDVWMALLAAYLTPPEGTPAPRARALEAQVVALLSSHGVHFPPSQVLDLLPPSMPVARIGDYLVTALRRKVAAQRRAAVSAALNRSVHMQVALAAAKARAPRSVVNHETLCSVCHKRLGSNVFARYPNEVVVHLKCCRDPHICPVTGVDFRPRPNQGRAVRARRWQA